MHPKLSPPLLPDLGAYAERIRLVDAPPGDVVEASAFAQPLWLEAALKLMAAIVGAPDLRVAASLWWKQYNSAVVMGGIAAMTLHGVGLDFSLPNTQIVLVDGVPRSVVVKELSTAVAYLPRGGARLATGSPCDLPTLHRAVFSSLFTGHIAHVITALCALTGVSKAILWGSVANLVADMFDRWAEDGVAEEAVWRDRQALLENPEAVGLVSPNPLYSTIDYLTLSEPDLPGRVRVRHTCCQKYLTRAGKACTTCPRLSMDERVALLRESLHKH